MVQPVALGDFFITFFSSALIILSGAGYALLLTWAGLRRQPGFLTGAYGCYAVLAVSVWVLARSAHLDGIWSIVTALMLIGYFLAPRAIYRLCIATHADAEVHSSHSHP